MANLTVNAVIDTFMQATDKAGMRDAMDTAPSILLGQTAGYGTTAAGDVVYLSDVDGKWEKVDADAEATSKGLIGVALNAVAEDATTLQVQIGGIYTTTGLTAGDVYYLSTTLGAWTNTAPSATGDIVRVVGFALSSTEMLIMQDQTYLEIEAAATYLSNVVEDTTPQLGGQLDVNGNAIGDGTLELLKFSETASAVNEVTVANAATGNGPTLSATGDDTNIDLNLSGKGTGVVKAGGVEVATVQTETLLFGFACSDETTALTTGEKVATDVPGSCVITRVYASCTTAPTHTTTALVVDVEDEGTTILNAASELTFATTSNNKEATSFSGAASSYALTKGDLLTIDVDSVGDGTAGAGLKVYFFGYWT